MQLEGRKSPRGFSGPPQQIKRASVSTVGDKNRPLRSDLCADVVVVGGGLAGIACALGLSDSGLKVVLLEETGSLGGRARSWTDLKSGDVIDLGPHVLLSEQLNMRAMLKQLGTHERVAWYPSKFITLTQCSRHSGLHSHPLTPPLHLLPSFAALSWREKMSNGPLLWLAMQLDEDDVGRLDDLSAAELLRRYGVAPRFVDWFWASLSMSLLNVPLEQCSAGALMRVCAQMMGHRRYSFGLADCALGELYIPSAMRTIMASGSRVHLRARVVALIYRDGKVSGVLLEDGTRVCATHCVLAVPPQALARLLPARCNAQRPFSETRSFEPSPHVSTYIWLDRKLSAEKLWTRAWLASNLNHDFYDLSNIRAGWRERPSLIASNIVYSHRAESMSDEEIVAATMRELAQVAPAAANAQVLHAVVNRIPMAIPCPMPGTEQRRPSTQTAIGGLLLAGDWTRTQMPACMESAVRSGWLAAERVWSAIGLPRQLALMTQPPEGIAGLVHRVARHARQRNQRGPHVPELAMQMPRDA
jgi:squalene-associated FAD-dependent desaturase